MLVRTIDQAYSNTGIGTLLLDAEADQWDPMKPVNKQDRLQRVLRAMREDSSEEAESAALEICPPTAERRGRARRHVRGSKNSKPRSPPRSLSGSVSCRCRDSVRRPRVRALTNPTHRTVVDFLQDRSVPFTGFHLFGTFARDAGAPNTAALNWPLMIV
jgi:hypothetical protein